MHEEERGADPGDGRGHMQPAQQDRHPIPRHRDPTPPSLSPPSSPTRAPVARRAHCDNNGGPPLAHGESAGIFCRRPCGRRSAEKGLIDRVEASMMTPFHRAALIVGAGHGLSAALARRLAREGHAGRARRAQRRQDRRRRRADRRRDLRLRRHRPRGGAAAVRAGGSAHRRSRPRRLQRRASRARRAGRDRTRKRRARR